MTTPARDSDTSTSPPTEAPVGHGPPQPHGSHPHGPHHLYPGIVHEPPGASAEELAKLPPVSGRLYNQELAPTQREGRTWRAYNIFTMWANDVHSLGNYGFALSLFALGMGAWQIVVALAIGAAMLFFILSLSGMVGFKLGVTFPVLSRIAYGIRGAQLPAIIRGGVAVIWFGIQTYLASLVLQVLLIALFPSVKSLDGGHALGLSALGWITFVFLWIVQVILVRYGMEMIRHYEAIAGPIVLLTLVALAVWMFVRAGGSIAWDNGHPLTGGAMWLRIIGGAILWVAIYGTFALNFSDFTRSARSRSGIIRGNFIGIPINTMLFAVIAVTLAGAQFKINGQTITSPADVVQEIPNTALLVLAALALLTLTIAVNLIANFVAPIFALTNLFPRRLNFQRAGLVSAIIGFVILPWNLYDNPAVINYFLGGLGALLGPLFGVIMIDYWVLRRTHVNVPDLYTEAPNADYHYRKGVNPQAVIAFVPAAALAVLIAFLPALKEIADFSWLIGAVVGAVVYYFIADRRGPFRDVSGEALAVPSVH